MALNGSTEISACAVRAEPEYEIAVITHMRTEAHDTSLSVVEPVPWASDVERQESSAAVASLVVQIMAEGPTTMHVPASGQDTVSRPYPNKRAADQIGMPAAGSLDTATWPP